MCLFVGNLLINAGEPHMNKHGYKIQPSMHSAMPGRIHNFSDMAESPLPILCHAVLVYSTLLYSTLLYSTLLYSTILYYTLLYSTLLYSTLLYSTPLHSTLLHSTPLHSTLLYYCYTVINILHFTPPTPDRPKAPLPGALDPSGRQMQGDDGQQPGPSPDAQELWSIFLLGSCYTWRLTGLSNYL